MDGKQALEERAALYHRRILEVAYGPGGMIVSFLRLATRRPFQEGDEMHWYLVKNLEGTWGSYTPRPTPAEWYYGENTLWTTGNFLWSQLIRYRVTGEQ